MADFDKVFSALRNCVTEPKCRDCPWEECERFDCKKVSVPANLLLDALKLLKEQEEKLVLDIADSVEGMVVGKCPRCDRSIVSKESKPTKFCKYCGQAVKFDDT